MKYEIIEVENKDKDKLYRLLQYALYDGSQYVNNEINEECIFEYKWFDDYFFDKKRNAYFIKNGNDYLGMVLVNEYLKYNNKGKCIAEFLIMPKYRRNHIGKKVAYDIFNKYKGIWEVEPMENNPIAYKFWKKTIEEYTNNNYEIKTDNNNDIFIFSNEGENYNE